MGSRLCGYCRSTNHRADKCNVKQAQIVAIRTHLYEEKKSVHQLIMDNGLGVGALLRDNDDTIYVIRSHADICNNYMNSFIEYRNIKYQKSVRSTLISYSGINHTPDAYIDNNLIRYNNRGYVSMQVHPLNDLATYTYATFGLNALPKPPLCNPESLKHGYYGSRNMEIVSPSYETDINPHEHFWTPIQIHERLGKDERGYGKRMDPLRKP